MRTETTCDVSDMFVEEIMLNFLHTESSENNIVATSFRWARPIGNLEAV